MLGRLMPFLTLCATANILLATNLAPTPALNSSLTTYRPAPPAPTEIAVDRLLIKGDYPLTNRSRRHLKRLSIYQLRYHRHLRRLPPPLRGRVTHFIRRTSSSTATLLLRVLTRPLYKRCPQCDGTGEASSLAYIRRHNGYIPYYPPCPTCRGQRLLHRRLLRHRQGMPPYSSIS